MGSAFGRRWHCRTTCRRAPLKFIQCVPFPGAADSVLVLTVGPAGRTGWKISPSGASTTAVTPLSPAALATIFSSAAPASQPFALIRTGHSSAN